MSYDLMVFKAEAAPRARVPFIIWYDQQTAWKETHGYSNPEVTTPELRSWLQEMQLTFKDENDDTAVEDAEDFLMAGYSIGTEIIYVTFPWPVAEQAYNLSKQLAARHRVGFFGASETEGEIIFPE